MKRKMFVVLAMLPLLMTGCTGSGSSASSSGKDAPVSSSQPVSQNPSTAEPEESSSQPVEDTTLPGLKKMMKYMAEQPDISMTSTNSNISIDFKGKQTIKSASSEETQDEVTPMYLKADLTKFNTQIAVIGLDETDAKDFKASLSTKGNISATYNFTSSDTADNKTVAATNASLSAYIKNGTAYADLSDEALSKLILALMGQSNPTIKSLGKVKYTNLLPAGPGIAVDMDKEDKFVEEFYAQYKGNSGLNTFVNLHSDEDYSYIDFTATTALLKTLPLVYTIIAQGQLDQTDPDYADKVAKINSTAEEMTKLVNKTTIKKFSISIAYTDNGIHHISNDIDMSIKDYTYTTDTDSSTSTGDDDPNVGGYMKEDPQEWTIENLRLAFNSKYTFKYGTSVKVSDPGADKDYGDISNIIGGGINL